MKRADIKRMLCETHPECEIDTEVTETMFREVPDSVKNKIMEKGMLKILNSEKSDLKTDDFVNAEIHIPQRKMRVFPAIAAACLIAGVISVPAAIKNRIYRHLPASYKPVTEIEADDKASPDKDDKTDFKLNEYMAFSEYTSLYGLTYAADSLFVCGETEYNGLMLLTYTSPETNETSYAEFFTMSDLPRKYRSSGGNAASVILSDYYVSDDGYFYYCGYAEEYDNRDKKDGFAGKYNLAENKTEALHFYSNKAFVRITMNKSGDMLWLLDKEDKCFQTDTTMESLNRNEEKPDDIEWPLTVHIDSSCPYIQNIHEFNGVNYAVYDFMEGVYRITSCSQDDCSKAVFYAGNDFRISENGDIFSTFIDYDEIGFAASFPVKCSNGIPERLGNETVGDGVTESCDENILIKSFDYPFGVFLYSVFSPDGEKICDFELPEGLMSCIGNKSSQTGEKIYCISEDKRRLMTFNPKSDEINEETLLSSKFDFSDSNLHIRMQGTGKYDIILWNKENLWGYNSDTKELVQIACGLDTCGYNFISFAVTDNGTVYCIAEGRNVVYSLEYESDSISPYKSVFSDDKNDDIIIMNGRYYFTGGNGYIEITEGKYFQLVDFDDEFIENLTKEYSRMGSTHSLYFDRNFRKRNSLDADFDAEEVKRQAADSKQLKTELVENRAEFMINIVPDMMYYCNSDCELTYFLDEIGLWFPFDYLYNDTPVKLYSEQFGYEFILADK